MTELATKPLPTLAKVWGTVSGSDGTSARITGLGGLAQLGDRIEIEAGSRLPGEIVATDPQGVTALLMAPAAGIATGQRAWLIGPGDAQPEDSWLGQVVDAFGRGAERPPTMTTIPPTMLRADQRRPLGPRINTGLGALDTFLPLARGQRLGVFAGSGVGKSRLLGDLALGVEADIVVAGLIGERSREVGDFVRLLRAEGGMDRCVVIAATSDESALTKRRASRLALATAEHFRDRGHQVLCLFDSVTRYAEAHREVALAAGEAPALRAFPPSTVQAIAGLCERAGPGTTDAQGDITAIFTVLVAGSDMEEPVADMVRGTLDGHVILDREIAERGRFPAIDVRRSVSRSAPAAWTEEEEGLAMNARRLLAAYEEAAPMIQAGLYAPGSDPVLDAAVQVWPELDAFIGSVVRPPDGASFARLATILQKVPQI